MEIIIRCPQKKLFPSEQTLFLQVFFYLSEHNAHPPLKSLPCFPLLCKTFLCACFLSPKLIGRWGTQQKAQFLRCQWKQRRALSPANRSDCPSLFEHVSNFWITRYNVCWASVERAKSKHQPSLAFLSTYMDPLSSAPSWELGSNCFIQDPLLSLMIPL